MRSARLLAIVALSLVVAWVLYPKNGDSQIKSQTTEITYWTVPEFMEPIKPVLKEFERRNPGYKVVMGTASVRDLSGDPTRFLLGVAGGVPPDVILFDRFAIVEWASRGAFTDLTPLLAATAGETDAIKKENFFAPAWNETVYRDKVYAIANEADTRAMFYRSDPLVRAGFVYRADEVDVIAGLHKAGDARPPKTWEELCRKRIHAQGSATADGIVTLSEYTRRAAVNDSVAKDARIDLTTSGVKAGDVVTLCKGSTVFRARIAEVLGSNKLRIDFSREQAPGTNSVPSTTRDELEIKVFDQDGYINKLNRFDPKTGLLTEAAFIPFYGDSWLYLYAWSNGAEFMSADGTKVTLDSPEIVGALQWLTDVHDCLGGADRARAFQYGATGAEIDPFLTDKIVMRIDTNPFLQKIVQRRPDLRFGVSAAPIPEARKAAGAKAIGWGGGFAYAIPETSKKKEAAWKLMQWMTSVEANVIAARAQASLLRARGQIYFPRLHSDTRVISALNSEFVSGNPALSDDVRASFQVFIDLLPVSRHRPVTPVGQMLWSEHVRATEAAINHAKPPYEALNYGKLRVQAALDQVLAPPTGRIVRWPPLIALYAGLVVVGLGSFLLWKSRENRAFQQTPRDWLAGYVCVSPWLIGFIVFGAGPILFSLVVSFCRYDTFSDARFVGLANYTSLLGRHHDALTDQDMWNDPLLWKSLGNTAYMIVSVPLSIVLGLAIALLVNNNVRGQRAFRTIFYLPAIIPAVASFLLWYYVFDPSRGLINEQLRAMGVSDPPGWLLDPRWSKPSLIIMMLWGVGGSMVIWLAGLKDIPESFYEAAAVDGAGPLRRFWYVTLPLLSPYILFNTIIGLIGVFQIFESSYIMTDGGPADSTLFYAYKLFNEAFRYLNMGAASAMAWILFVIVLVLTSLQLWLGKKWVHYGW